MEAGIAIALGAMTGCGVGRTHASINGGTFVNLLAGGVGGFLGALILGPTLTEPLGESGMAGAAAGAGIGGLVLALAVGIARNRLGGKR